MKTYRFNHRYSSGLGTWEQGAEQPFEDDVAAHLLRDSPGCLEEVKPEPKAAAPEPESEPEPEPRALDAPPADRMVRQPQRRRDRTGDPGDQGAITRENFGAVKNKGDR